MKIETAFRAAWKRQAPSVEALMLPDQSRCLYAAGFIAGAGWALAESRKMIGAELKRGSKRK